MLTNF